MLNVLYTVYFVLVNFAQCGIHCVMYILLHRNLLCTVYVMCCAQCICSVLYTLFNAQCVVYIVLCQIVLV